MFHAKPLRLLQPPPNPSFKLDTGGGIPTEQHQQIFERFYRGEHQNIFGSGLGLSIVQRITELYHIEIQVKNMAKGLCVTTHLTCIDSCK